MKIAVLHGQRHQGSTCHITRRLLDRVSFQTARNTGVLVHENHACVGCFSCFKNGEDTCPHWGENRDIMAALEAADVIIVQSPNYCMGMTGQLKIFMDHMTYRCMSHRSYPAMFGKVGVVISTTAGAGAGQVTKVVRSIE